MNYRIESRIDDVVIEFTSDFNKLMINGKDYHRNIVEKGGHIFGDRVIERWRVPETRITYPSPQAWGSGNYLHIMIQREFDGEFTDFVIDKLNLEFYGGKSFNFTDITALSGHSMGYAQKSIPIKSARKFS